jgi:hypothetical protein
MHPSSHVPREQLCQVHDWLLREIAVLPSRMLVAATKGSHPSAVFVGLIVVLGAAALAQAVYTIVKSRKPELVTTRPSVVAPSQGPTSSHSFQASLGARFRDFWNVGIASIFLAVAGGVFLDYWVDGVVALCFEVVVVAFLVRGLVRSSRLGVTIDEARQAVTVSGFIRDIVVPFRTIYAVQTRRSINTARGTTGAKMVALNVENRKLVSVAAASADSSDAAQALRSLASRLGVPCSF